MGSLWNVDKSLKRRVVTLKTQGLMIYAIVKEDNKSKSLTYRILIFNMIEVLLNHLKNKSGYIKRFFAKLSIDFAKLSGKEINQNVYSIYLLFGVMFHNILITISHQFIVKEFWLCVGGDNYITKLLRRILIKDYFSIRINIFF